MPPLLDRKLRFADVIYAIEATPKMLRNWLQRDQVKLEFSEHSGGWRDFSHADIAILALVRRMVEFGIGVEDASGIANWLLFSRARPLKVFKNTPPAALPALFNNSLLLVWREDDEWKHRVLQTSDGIYRRDEQPTDTFLTIDVGAVLRRAFERAAATAPEATDAEEAFASSLEELRQAIIDSQSAKKAAETEEV